LQDLLLGIDLGTGGCKITIIDYEGKIIAESTEEYKTHHPAPSFSEQDPADWFDALIKCLDRIKKDRDRPPRWKRFFSPYCFLPSAYFSGMITERKVWEGIHPTFHPKMGSIDLKEVS